MVNFSFFLFFEEKNFDWFSFGFSELDFYSKEMFIMFIIGYRYYHTVSPYLYIRNRKKTIFNKDSLLKKIYKRDSSE